MRDTSPLSLPPVSSWNKRGFCGEERKRNYSDHWRNVILASTVCSGHGAVSIKVLFLTILTCVNLLTKSYRRQRRTDTCSWPLLFGFPVIFLSLSLHKAGIFQSQALSSRPKGVHLRVIKLVTFSRSPSIPRKHFLILLIIKALFFSCSIVSYIVYQRVTSLA